MELKRKQENNTLDLEEKMADWPACIYAESDADIRFALLDEAVRQGLAETAGIRQIMEKRYVRGRNAADRFIMFWMQCSMAGDRLADRDKRELQKQADALGFGECSEELLYREFYHTALVFIHLSSADKQYGSFLYGTGRLSDKRLSYKLCRDLFRIGYPVPEAVRFARYEIWEKALKDVCFEYFTDGEEYWHEQLAEI